MKNNFKKQDHKGNKLEEQIGQGVNYDHWKKVKEARKKTSSIRFMLTEKEKQDFKDKVSGISGVNESEILRMLVNEFVNSKIKIK